MLWRKVDASPLQEGVNTDVFRELAAARAWLALED